MILGTVTKQLKRIVIALLLITSGTRARHFLLNKTMDICNLVYTAQVQPTLPQKIHVKGKDGGACVIQPWGHVWLGGFKTKRSAMSLLRKTVPQACGVVKQPTLVNCLVQTRLPKPLDMHALRTAFGADVNWGSSSKFNSVMVHDGNKRGTCIIYPSGVIACVGCRNLNAAKRRLTEVKQQLLLWQESQVIE